MEKEHKSGKKDSTKIGAVIILIISAIVFIPVGGSAVLDSIASKKNTPVFGSYKGKNIEYSAGSDFYNNLTNLVRQYEYMGRNNVSKNWYIYQQAFNNTVSQMFYEDQLKASGYTVPESAINRRMLPYFYDENGVYSERKYNQTDAATKKNIRTEAKEYLTASRYLIDFLGTQGIVEGSQMYGLKTSSKEAAAIAKMGDEKHSFVITSFDTADFPAAEAVKYALDNKAKFTKYNLSAVTLATKDDAEAVLKQIQNNEITFEDAVSEKSGRNFTDSTGKLSNMFQYQLLRTVSNDAEAMAALSSLKKDELSAVIPTSQGFTIFRCDGATEEPDFTLEDNINVALNYVKTNEQGYVENYYTETAKGFVAESALTTFEDACEKFGIESVEVPAFPINYSNEDFYAANPADVEALSSLSTSYASLKAMFNLKAGETSSPFVLGTKILVAKCTGIQSDATEIEDFASKVTDKEERTLNNYILANDVENNVLTTCYKYFMN